MIKTFKTDRINNINVALIKLAIFFAALISIYIVYRIKPDLMENNFLSNTSILTILIIFILGFIFQLFENIFRKRVNEISIDTDQHLMKINYYSLIEGNVQRKLLYENMVFQIKESTDSSFKIYNKNKREEPPISISIYKDGFNKTTFKELIDLLIILTKAVSK